MQVKGSFAVENSVIVPLFILLFLGLITITAYYHDRIIAKNAVELVAVRLEQSLERDNHQEMENMRQQLQAYIGGKTLFLKEITLEIKEENKTIKVVCQGRFPLGVVPTLKQDISVVAEIGQNRPCERIRIIEAAKEVFQK